MQARRMRRGQRERPRGSRGPVAIGPSQHLAKMRAEGLVTFRRESQTLWYRIADPRIEQLFATLHKLFCRPAKAKGR